MAVLEKKKKFAMRAVFEMLLRKPIDNSIVAYLTDCKTSGLISRPYIW